MARILTVDDNSQNLYLLEVLLKTNGFIVDQASNGVEALEAARKNKPALIITDILMPTMDGFSLCRKWKNDSELCGIPFVFYTATYTEKKDEDFALSLGADRFVIKPQSPDDLLKIINETLNFTRSKTRKLTESRALPKDEEYLKSYNEALIRKLEKKMVQLEMSNKRLNAFYQVSCDLVTIKSSHDIIQKVLKAIHEIIGYQRVVFFLYDEKKQSLEIDATFGFHEDTQLMIKEKLGFSPVINQSLAGISAKSRQVINIPDTTADKRWITIDESIRSALFIPVQFEENLIGVLGLYSSELDAFSQNENDVVSLANSLAISIINNQTQEKMLQLNLELEDRIKERTSQLQTSNNDLEAFAYSVSHDLRAPLRAITGYSIILMEDCEKSLNEDGIKYLGLINQNAQRMDKLITDLLALSKVSLSDKKYSTVDMFAMTSGIISEIVPPERKEEITFEVDPLPEVYADPTLIRQVWTNLILNAIKYSGRKDHPMIRIQAKDNEQLIVFSVEDNGIGFNQEIAQNLFQPFQRLFTEDEFEGTGIGLTIVKRIVERHGGKVWAEGKQNQGAKFYFSIPKLKK